MFAQTSGDLSPVEISETKNDMRRRLLARYGCIQSGHHLCFVGKSGTHVPLTGVDIESWVDAWVSQSHFLTE